MSIFIAWGNSQQSYPFPHLPAELLTEKLRQAPPAQPRLQQRYCCRWVAHFLLWQLAKMAKIPTALLADIQYSSTQRPHFATPNIDFNLSHSGEWVAVILKVGEGTKESAVGIDIEFPQRERDYTALLAHFASPQEQQWFSQQPDKKTAFYQIWCLREALLKSQGVGIAKLSEVEHLADEYRLHTLHAPQGEAFFTAELPFYLACFANDRLEPNHTFCWNGEALQPSQLRQKISYQTYHKVVKLP
ncbi:4'-phosphopantetheinyl transferase family protein [Avibacterium paragallinarum]|uniref:4'-phosphopantetheinyl transferase n=1 Tax=Avibacterium paragallinarum TaxID=728 RepID=A0A377IC87_AVIPA|nr:4'-phosphopantetheinyl transferase superfamily protein [Avibacterium paragallinarum]POY45974.1 4'-phosphopantetheinyl transferase [Avibacterium paragallinarum]RZN75383.1 4'-phosphopantetheinyl transferase superfamily protein [Avibacterium paragallinarum]CDF98479.1 Putative Sfp protein [Avibacterium paragallinarum JF4211]STO72853.1 4'-phosphopantetheinyl transferase [Avibacterium paragallinarum]